MIGFCSHRFESVEVGGASEEEESEGAERVRPALTPLTQPHRVRAAVRRVVAIVSCLSRSSARRRCARRRKASVERGCSHQQDGSGEAGHAYVYIHVRNMHVCACARARASLRACGQACQITHCRRADMKIRPADFQIGNDLPGSVARGLCPAAHRGTGPDEANEASS